MKIADELYELAEELSAFPPYGEQWADLCHEASELLSCDEIDWLDIDEYTDLPIYVIPNDSSIPERYDILLSSTKDTGTFAILGKMHKNDALFYQREPEQEEY